MRTIMHDSELELAYKHQFDIRFAPVHNGGMDLRWRHVETALVKLLNVEEEQMGAFRARLRHLKAVGVPNIPKVGSGTQIIYTREQVVDLYLALLITRFGITPRSAAWFIADLHDSEKNPRSMDFIPERGDFFFVLFPANDGSAGTWHCRGLDNLTRMMALEESDTIQFVPREAFNPMAFKAYSIINVTKCLRAADEALKL